MKRFFKFLVIYLFFYFILTYEFLNPHNIFGKWGNALIALLISGFLYFGTEKLSKINGLGEPKSILSKRLLVISALILISLFILIISFWPFFFWHGDQT